MGAKLNNKYCLAVILLCIATINLGFAQNCPQIEFKGSLQLSLNENELSLLCPISDGKRQSIPHYQAKFYLRGFLQSRGHLKPTLKEVGERLEVSPNEKSYLNKIEVDQKQTELAEEIKRFYQGKIVSPLLLNKIEEFVVEYYKKKGHPCPKALTNFSTDKGLLEVDVQGLKQKKFGQVSYEKISGVHKNFIKRFEAFKPHQEYRPQKLELTKKRIFRSSVVQSTYYQKNCSDTGSDFNIKQSFVPGPPRTLRFGVGANTEVGPMARLRWTHHRFKQMASTLQANVQASFKEQSLSLGSDIYLWEDSPRRSWKSEFRASRTSESDYEEISSSVEQKIKWTAESLNHHYIWQTGPVLEASSFKTDVDQSRQSLLMPSWQADLKIQGHEYELYDLFPQEGHQVKLSTDIRPTWLNNKFDIYQFEFKSVKLMPLAVWGKGDLVGGVRLDYKSTWVDNETKTSAVPPGLRYYGGGDSSNRGQRLNSLPKNNGLGALSHALLRFELRRTHAFIKELEILVFTDFSKFSERPWRLEETLWASPGLGVRWLSPIGPVQAYAARSLEYNPHKDDGMYFFIGLGGEL